MEPDNMQEPPADGVRWWKTIVSGIVVAVATLTGAVAAAQGTSEDFISRGVARGVFVGGGLLIVILAAIIIFVGLFMLWVAMLVDAVRRKSPSRVLWISILIASLIAQPLWLVAAIVYYYTVRKPLGPIAPAKV